jgi:hypothetical protein
LANNVTVRDASGSNQTFNTWYDTSSSTHRSQVLCNLATGNAYVTNTNPVPVLETYSNGSFVTNTNAFPSLMVYSNGGVVANTTAVPALLVLSNGTPMGLGANALGMYICDGANAAISAVYTFGNQDGNAPTTNAQLVASLPLAFNGATFDRVRNNQDSTANLVTWTTANTTTSITQSSNQTNYNWRGAIFYLTITAVAGTSANVQLTVNNIDPVSGKYNPILVTAATTTNTAQEQMYMVYPGITSTANVNVGLLLSRTWCANITCTGTGTNTTTGRLTATMML